MTCYLQRVYNPGTVKLLELSLAALDHRLRHPLAFQLVPVIAFLIINLRRGILD